METMWTIVCFIVALLIGGAFNLITISSPEFSYAKVCLGAAAIILASATLIWSIRTDQHSSIRIFITVIIWVFIGVGLPESLRWINSKENSSATIQPQGPEPYNIGVRSALIYDGEGDLSLFMAEYQSMMGKTISPIYYLMHIFISNGKIIPTTIEGYSASVGDNESGPWQELMPIPLSGVNLYSIGYTGITTSGTIAFPKGAYRLGTSMKPTDLSKSVLIDASPKIESLLTTAVQPGQTVSGWAAFDLRDHKTKAIRNYFRITLRDSMGISFSKIISLPKRIQGDPEMETQIGGMKKIGPVVDLSSSKVRYYSEQYPTTQK